MTADRPLPGESRPYAFPRFERRTLSNGLGLVIAPLPKLPVVTLLALADAGAVTDRPGEEGLAVLRRRKRHVRIVSRGVVYE